MDSAQWTQEFGVAKSMAEKGGPNACSKAAVTERKARPQKDEAVNCPRCHSTNTKFCYYNNYSLTQPRYFCKTCRRYWTEGGTLRNVPVGGGSRKNKKSSSSIITPSPLSSHAQLPDLNPKIHDQGHDLNLGFHGDYGHVVPQFLEFPKIEGRDAINSASNSANTSSSAAPLSALNFLRNGIAGRGLNSFFPMGTSGLDQNNAIFASNFPFQECKPGLSFPIEDSRYESSNNATQDNVNNNGSLMFTLGGASRRNRNVNDDQDEGQENSNGFWNGMLGGGSW